MEQTAITRERLSRAVAGCLLGTAVGDSLGLPFEGLSRSRTLRICGSDPLRQRLILGRGMISDDTEHTCMVAQALLASRGDPEVFVRSLSWRFRGWLAGLPAGVGLATLRSICRLWLGFSWKHSGVYSAGNGPAMRAAVLGLYAHENDASLRELVHRSTRITHTDPRAEEGALLIAMAARHTLRRSGIGPDPDGYLSEAAQAIIGDRFRESLLFIGRCLSEGRTAAEFAEKLDLTRGVGGFVLHTVPVCLYCWLRHPDDFRAGLESVIRLGGDTDSTGAIVGALLGTQLGPKAIPHEWLSRLAEWPRSVGWIERVATQLSASLTGGQDARPVPLFWPSLPLRNAFFLLVVLTHGFRRLLPPY